MKIGGMRPMTLSFIILIILFLSFVQGLFRLQLFKHTVNAELLGKLQIETVRLAADYQDIQEQAAASKTRILRGNADRSRLVAGQVTGYVRGMYLQDTVIVSLERTRSLLMSLEKFQDRKENCFWIFDETHRLVLGPPDNLTDVGPINGRDLVEQLGGKSEGTVLLRAQDLQWENPGYAIRLPELGWTVAAFQPWLITDRKLEAVEALRRLRTDRLIAEAGAKGSAGVAGPDLLLIEYPYAQMKGKHVNQISMEGEILPSELLFNRKDGIREYVIRDPVSGLGKYRQGFMHFDEKTGNTYFVTQNKRELFREIDRRLAPLLGYLGGVCLLLMAVNIAIVAWGLLSRGSDGGGKDSFEA